MKREKIEDALLEMGVPARIKGFTFIADAIEYIDGREGVFKASKELYPSIAEKRDTTPSRVERAIRHAFETTRSAKGDIEKVNHYIGFIHCENASSLKQLYMMLKREEHEFAETGN